MNLAPHTVGEFERSLQRVQMVARWWQMGVPDAKHPSLILLLSKLLSITYNQYCKVNHPTCGIHLLRQAALPNHCDSGLSFPTPCASLLMGSGVSRTSNEEELAVLPAPRMGSGRTLKAARNGFRAAGQSFGVGKGGGDRRNAAVPAAIQSESRVLSRRSLIS